MCELCDIRYAMEVGRLQALELFDPYKRYYQYKATGNDNRPTSHPLEPYTATMVFTRDERLLDYPNVYHPVYNIYLN